MKQTLAGRVVVVTRPRAASAAPAAALRALGARVVFAPLIRALPPRSWRGLDAALRELASFDAVAFASVNAVEFFFARLKTIGRPARPKIVAAVGPATAAALSARGWKPSLIPEDARAAGLARALRLPRGSKVLLPRAERGLKILPRALSAAGARVTRATVYRTLPDPAGRRALRRALASGADAVCFASPSAVAAAAGLLGRDVAVVAIGPTTAAALRRRCAVAARPDAKSMASAVVAALKIKR